MGLTDLHVHSKKMRKVVETIWFPHYYAKMPQTGDDSIVRRPAGY